MRPPFVMSKYANLADLQRDKAAYYEQLAKTLAVNANNPKLSDAEFRKFVCNCTTEFADDGAEVLLGATRAEIVEVMMQDVVGDYNTPDQVPEWA